jgi:hypothetical protein
MSQNFFPKCQIKPPIKVPYNEGNEEMEHVSKEPSASAESFQGKGDPAGKGTESIRNCRMLCEIQFTL